MRNPFKSWPARRSIHVEQPEITISEGYGWQVNHEKAAVAEGDAATLPMQTWQADPAEIAEMTQTAVIPKIVPDGPEAAFIALSYNDVDASCMAARTLRGTRSIETVLAGLVEYVQRHPVAA